MVVWEMSRRYAMRVDVEVDLASELRKALHEKSAWISEFMKQLELGLMSENGSGICGMLMNI
jgi:hypothetical protein